MDNLEPITRNEMFLNGDDLEPITREEMILAGEDLEPITRHEWFLKKYRGGGGGGGYDLVNIPNLPADIASFNDGTDLPMASLKVAVTPYQDLHGYDGPWAGGAGKNKCWLIPATKRGLTLTANDDGTYTLTGDYTGTAPNTIGNSDNVVLKAGTYILNSGVESSFYGVEVWNDGLPTSRGASYGEDVTFTISSDTNVIFRIYIKYNASMGSADLTFRPMLRLSGTTSEFEPYENICPIIGWDEAVVTVADDVDNPTVSHEYTIDLDGTRYGGTLDAVSGVMTLTHGFADLSELTAIYNSGWNCWTIQPSELPNAKVVDSNNTPTTDISDRFKAVKASGYTTAHESGTIAQNTSRIWFIDNGSTTELSGQLCYELATPITLQLAQTPVKSIEGENNISANCGQITEVKYFKKA